MNTQQNYKILKECGLWSIIEVNMEVIMGHDCGNSKEFGVGHYHVTLKKDSILLIIVHIVTRLYIDRLKSRSRCTEIKSNNFELSMVNGKHKKAIHHSKILMSPKIAKEISDPIINQQPFYALVCYSIELCYSRPT